jgi:hypothetical protein
VHQKVKKQEMARPSGAKTWKAVDKPKKGKYYGNFDGQMYPEYVPEVEYVPTPAEIMDKAKFKINHIPKSFKIRSVPDIDLTSPVSVHSKNAPVPRSTFARAGFSTMVVPPYVG